jgi:hypothetical protein
MEIANEMKGARRLHSSGDRDCLSALLLARQYPWVTESGRTRRYPFAVGVLPNPLPKRRTSPTVLSPLGQPSLPLIAQEDRVRIVETLEQVELGCRWAARRSGEARTETNHAAFQDEKERVSDLYFGTEQTCSV